MGAVPARPHDLAGMAEVVVRRVSTGSPLFRAALGAAQDTVRGYEIPTYDQIQSLVMP